MWEIWLGYSLFLEKFDSHLTKQQTLLRQKKIITLTFSWRRPLSYRNQPINLQSKSMDWFLYDNGLRHERVKLYTVIVKRSLKLEHVYSWLDNTFSFSTRLIFSSFDTFFVMFCYRQFFGIESKKAWFFSGFEKFASFVV